jgi:ABC-type antimicrobial peptide transport system permease subunit
MIQLRQTVRRLLQAPGFTLTTVLTLAIGIGATTAIFSVVNGVLIKPLPFPKSGVTALDPVTYVAVSAILVVTALLAGYLPARRVTRVDPMRALRAE